MDEEVLIPLFLFLMIFLIVKLAIDFKKWKIEREGPGGEGASLRTSELKALMTEAVYEANLPLQERIKSLEQQLERLERRRVLPESAESERRQLPHATEEREEQAKADVT